MNVWPVLAREVRQAARQPATYRARWIAALVVLGAGIIFAFRVGNFEPGQGARVFSWLYLTVFISTFVMVPLFTADCLSRERREGTLGLLFLTPLRALDIVLAKLAAHGLRGLTLWFSAVPVFTIPILIGGVSWQQATGAVLFNFSALMLSLAAGILASAFSKTWSKSVIWSLMIAVVLLIGWLHLLGFGVTAYAVWVETGRLHLDSLFSDQAFRGAWIVVLQWAEVVQYAPWGRAGANFGPTRWFLMLSAVGPGLSAVILFLACAVAARATRRNWQEAPPSPLRVSVERRFTTPILGQDLLKRWLRRTLDHNPVGWLERRTWTGRMIMFGWLAIVIGVFSGLVPQLDFWRMNMRRYEMDLIDVLLAQPLLLSMAAAAAGSFRRERETGVLELLLVSPLSAPTIVLGRIRGLYAQFMPSVLLIVAGWIFLLTLIPSGNPDRFNALIRFVAGSVAVPCVGLYLSLRTRNFLAAFLITVLTGWGVPWGAALLYRGMTDPYASGAAVEGLFQVYATVPATVSLLLGGLATVLLIRRLEQRQGIVSDAVG